MKPTLLIATLTMVFATPKGSAATELETLRARCAAQEQQLQKLEAENRRLQGKSPEKSELSAVSTPAAADSNAATYRIKAGDSIERIASKTGCSVEKLAKLNDLKTSSIIHPGQTLKLPDSSKPVKEPAPIATSKHTEKAVVSASGGKTYKIKDGETYYSISKKLKIPMNSMIAANPGIKPTQLRTGQVIHLSRSSSSPASNEATASAKSEKVATPTPPRAPEPPKTAPHVAETPAISKSSSATVSAPKPSPQPAAPAPAPASTESKQTAAVPAEEAPPASTEKKIRSVTIDGEVTYGEFAASHGTNTNRLNELNGLDLTNATVLAKGSELYVPAQP
ncbi:MAG: LysM peptidoglycan-binding domain-containing protein [Gloeobacteraceae cyanobacterium ES-bin-144]|nr:LysM peptidoglycan-binding domain-containing protein [Verrucomicrobiales bacterium]